MPSTLPSLTVLGASEAGLPKSLVGGATEASMQQGTAPDSWTYSGSGLGVASIGSKVTLPYVKV